MTFTTNNSIADCNAKLAAAIDTGWWAYVWGHKQMLGVIANTAFELRVRSGYFREFAPIFYGRFIASNNVTLVQGDFKINPFSKVFLIFWFSILGLFGLGILILGLIGEASVKDMGKVILIVIVLLALGVLFEILGRWSTRMKQRTIIAFLKETLEASDVETESALKNGKGMPPVILTK